MAVVIVKWLRNIDEHFQEVLIKGAWAFFVRLGGAFMAFLVNIYLARLLGVEKFGLFTLAVTIITILMIFSRLGLDTVLLRDVASKNDAAESGYARAITNRSILIALIVSVVMGLLVVIYKVEISMTIFKKPDLENVLLAMLPSLFFMTVTFLIADTLKAVKSTSNGVFLQNTVLPVLFLIALVVINPVHHIQDTIFVAAVYSAATLIALMYGSILYFRKTCFVKNKWKQSTSKLLKKGFPLLLMASGGLLLSWTDVIVLGIFDSERTVGLYTAAVKISFLTSFVLVATNSIIAPKFSTLYSEKDFDGLKRLSSQSTKLMIILALPPTIMMMIFPEWILSWFGAVFSGAAKVLMILAVGQFVNVACGSVGYMLIMTGNEIIMRNIMIFTAILNIILSILFVKWIGMVGVAISTAISVVTWNIIALFYVKTQALPSQKQSVHQS